jgi:hypothetical protein
VGYEVNGVSEQVVVPPSELRSAGDRDEWCAARLSPIQGAESLIGDRTDIDAATATREPLDNQAIVDHLETYGSRGRLGISYADAVRDTIPGDARITIEGGDD